MLPSAMPVAFAAALLVAGAEHVPSLDIEASCRAAARMGDRLSLDAGLRQCLADENGAHEQLAKQWTQFSSALRQRCVATTETDGNPSYVEVLVCRQIGRDATQMDRSSSGPQSSD